jgi:hypothetical protein
MAELVSLSMRHFPRAVKADNPSPQALESWMARTAQRGM